MAQSAIFLNTSLAHPTRRYWLHGLVQEYSKLQLGVKAFPTRPALVTRCFLEPSQTTTIPLTSMNNDPHHFAFGFNGASNLSRHVILTDTILPLDVANSTSNYPSSDSDGSQDCTENGNVFILQVHEPDAFEGSRG